MMMRSKMATTDTYPYQPDQLSHHAVVVAFLSCLFFIPFEIMSALNDHDKDIVWWSMHVCLIGFFYFFRQTLIAEPSYSNFNKWYFSWLFVAAVYHYPSTHWMVAFMRMNLSLFLTTFASSILCLLVFHSIFDGFCYILSRTEIQKWPDIRIILQLSAVVSIACCFFLSECRDERPLEPRNLKDQVCSYWLITTPRVESLSYYYSPLFAILDNYGTIYVIYGKFDKSGSPKVTTDEIYPVYSLWATFIGLYIANYIAAKLSASKEEYEKKKKRNNEQMKPDFSDMVPWYSGTSADLYKTVFDIVVSVNVFLGRFDMRILQAATSVVEGVSTNRRNIQDGVPHEDFLYDVYSEKEELWFDFIADTGDGGNSTYTVARLLAQHSITLRDCNLSLNRGDLLLIGGDIAYPNPSQITYERRLFRPFDYAFQPPPWAEQARMAVNKHPGPPRVYGQVTPYEGPPYEGPRCFLIPGNHDWFDGLHTFMRNICHKSWLGGWFMPQRKSYFALKLPKGWWVFGLDLALQDDIDVYQFEFFSKLAQERVGEKGTVIVMTHQPDWIINWYDKATDSKNNVSDLMCNILKERCKLRIAGDIHHYMHHSVKSGGSDEPAYAPHLLVNGCGGAFLHPTHVFRDFNKSHGVSYKLEKAYPSFEISRRLALKNILNFRKQNWRFDFIGGILYFILVFSMFPQCELGHIFQSDSVFSFLRNCFGTVLNAFIYMLDHSYASLGGSILFLLVAIAFTPSKAPWKTRIAIGIFHFSTHLIVALVIMLVLELSVEMLVRNKLLATSGYHSLYQWYQSVESRYSPLPNVARAFLEQWTFGLYPACIKYLMSAFDVPELMAVTRSNICEKGMESLSRRGAIVYYFSVFLYFWIFSTQTVSLVFGSYLYICINWFNLHYDEAFSSLRIADYKAFTRFHIQSNGDLKVFTLAVDKVPEEWQQDPEWEKESSQTPEELSHRRKVPSQWKAAAPSLDPLATVRIIEEFVISKKDHSPNISEAECSQTEEST
ncbi:hypothetical protein I3843_16G050000 [Carya illinoinensis]|nr:hypothetical protein I3843_16G050000 [Carya illinoinensis]KAG7941542.1 hypothetical protein I3843_16G050000 [Carya illinoinensis]